MQTRTVEQVESWESRPFSGGFESLHELSDEDFTGAVVAEDTWLFMLNGRVVGVFQGDIDEFEEESGTVYVAPHDSLPLLFSMKERGGSTRAKYFTNDTPIPEADETLSEANFTGYVELSENVLSGDYYLVYYGGKQMSSAFIGQSERLITGEDAYERAADEVGIYEVKDVSMNITEIPAPPEPESESRTAVGGAVEGAGEETDGTEAAEPTEESVDDSTDEGAAPDEAAETQPSTGPAETPAESTEAPAESTEAPAESTEAPAESTEVPGESTEAPAESTEAPAESTEAPAGREESTTPDQDREQPFNRESTEEDVPDAESAVDEADETSADRPETSSGPTEDPLSDRRSEPEPEPETDDTVATPGGETESTKDELQHMFEREEEWRQTRSIPALDPEETEQPEDDDEEPDRPPKRRPRKRKENEPSERTAAKSGVSHERVDELRRAIESREDQIEELSDSVETVKAERNEMEQELADLRAERDDLEERVSNLESALQRAKDQQASVDTTATTLEPGEALAGTNLFVRYESKGKPTLEALQGGEVDPEAVNENLKLEHHTKFEADEVRIQGEPFEEFLAETSTFRFVSWLVRELPYELVDSGKRTALGDLYEAIPAIDRIEFEGTVTVPRAEGSAETMEFGVVMRDRMGNPLIVAELNDDRDPVPVEEMTDLIEAAQAVGDAEGTFASAIFVTASFFQPAALEAAEGAASSGGLFSRSDKASYVKTANKSGFHLCLVEDRAESFHVTVPEL